MADTYTSTAAEKLADWFGDRCTEYNSECSTCRAWEAFDAAIARAEQAEARERAMIDAAETNRQTLLRHNADHAAGVTRLTAQVAELEAERAEIEDAMGPLIHSLADMFDDYAKDSPELAAKLAEIRSVFPMPSAALAKEEPKP